MDARKTATLTGWLMVITFITSIPAYFVLYAPVRDNPGLITGAGDDPTISVGLGAVLELILIVANLGTAVVPYAVFKRHSQSLALGYVVARLVEGIFIAIGVLSLLTFLFMREQGTAAANPALGDVFVAIYDRAFLLGPGIFAGVANGMVLGWLMYRSGLVPRGLALFGLVGGPALVLTAITVMLGLTERGSSLQGLATIPEFIWELSFGVYLIAKGFKPVPAVTTASDATYPVATGTAAASASGV